MYVYIYIYIYIYLFIYLPRDLWGTGRRELRPLLVFKMFEAGKPHEHLNNEFRESHFVHEHVKVRVEEMLYETQMQAA